MALEAVVFPQDPPPFSYNTKEAAVLSFGWIGGEDGVSWEPSENKVTAAAGVGEAGGQRKRRRMRSPKNEEEVRNQRMIHIAVERNRRKQMNDYLAALRKLIPPEKVPRNDQASTIGSAINYIRELEQQHQLLEARKRIKQRSDDPNYATSALAGFLSFPQYSSSSSSGSTNVTSSTPVSWNICNENLAERRSAAADVEVTMVEGHANVKILAKRRPKQLLKLVVGLQNLRLTTLHLNMTTVEEMALYTFSLKVEDDCKCTTADEIATQVYQLIVKIEEEPCSS